MDDSSSNVVSSNVVSSNDRSSHLNSALLNKHTHFGHHIRLAMSCIEGKLKPEKGPALPACDPTNESAIKQRLKALSQDITSHHADLLELLVRFDDLQGWTNTGASHCAAWMNTEIGISIQLGWEYLRVGRQLAELTTLRALFRAGKLSWSKVRLITRVANTDNEKLLCHAALDASVSDVKRLCEGYRWDDNNDEVAENNQALQQWDSRSFTWNETSNGCTRIQLVLPPEIAQAFLNSVEHSLNQMEPSTSKMAQRRADAATLMAESSLQAAGKDISNADRYQVIVSVCDTELSTTKSQVADSVASKTPSMRAKLSNATTNSTAISKEKARRIACDCSISTITKHNGEPIDIGQKSRIWPAPMARAIKERDQKCVWPGCTQSNHLHIHHIKHWADGGSTSVQNGVCLCAHHHTLVHEGGFTLENIDNDIQKLDAQFMQQQRADDLSMFDFEKTLRNDRDSFDAVRRLSPAQYRFRVIDTKCTGHKHTDSHTRAQHGAVDSEHSDSTHNDSTHVECREAAPAYDSKIIIDNSVTAQRSSPCESKSFYSRSHGCHQRHLPDNQHYNHHCRRAHCIEELAILN